MSGKKITYNPPATKPKRPIAERVVSERGRKELPPGTKGGGQIIIRSATLQKEERQHANYSVECSYHTTSNTR